MSNRAASAPVVAVRQLHGQLRLLRRAAAQPVGCDIRRNPVEPGRGLRLAAELRPSLRRLGEHDLGQVLGVWRTDHAQQQPLHRRAVGVVQRAK
jgi:hypothetical protein